MIRRLPRLLLATPLLAAAIAAGCGSSPSAEEAGPAGVPEPSALPVEPTSSEPATAPGPAEPPAEPAPAGVEEPTAPDPVAPVECTAQTFPSQVPAGGDPHVDELPPGFEYNSVPASQGPHDPRWLIWNWYEVEVPEVNKVHNLEHGGIAVQWGPEASAETIAELREWYAADPNGIIAAPHPGLGSTLALTAWFSDRSASTAERLYAESTGHLLTCTGFDEAAFSDFRDTYRGQGPEPFPVRLLRPGTDGTG